MKAAKKKRVSLKKILSYQNPAVVSRFCKAYNFKPEIGKQIFKDMLRFFWLGHVIGRDKTGKLQTLPGAVMFSSMNIVDEMWHTFVLFTVDYEKFCHEYFGYFIHHVPTPEEEKSLANRGQKARAQKAAKVDPAAEAAAKRIEEQSDVMIELVWQKLGAEIARRWYYEYGKKYPNSRLIKRQLAA